MKPPSIEHVPASLTVGLLLAAAVASLWLFLENTLAFAVVPDLHVFLLRNGFFFVIFLWLLLLAVMTYAAWKRTAQTARLAAERDELAMQLDRYRKNARAGEWEWHAASNRIEWSDETFRLFGVRKDLFEPSLERFLSFLHPEDRPRFEEAIERTLRDEAGFQTTIRIFRPNGVQRTMEISGQRRSGSNNGKTGVAGLILDITETVHLRESTRQQGSRLRAFSDICRDSLVVVDDDGRFDSLNPAAEKLLGVSVEETIGKNTDSVFLFEHGEKEMTALELLNAIGPSVFSRPRLTVFLLRESGKRRHVALQAIRFGGGDDRRILLSIRDLPGA